MVSHSTAAFFFSSFVFPLRILFCHARKPIPKRQFPDFLRQIASDHRAVVARPSGGGRVTIGRWSLDHRSVVAGNLGEKNGNHRGKNEKSRRSSIPLPGICRPMLVRKGSRYSQKRSVPQVAQWRMTPRKNQANTQVTFIKSLADRIIF